MAAHNDGPPPCPASDSFFMHDRERMRSLEHQVADDEAQALSPAEVDELQELRDRWKRYCAWSGKRDAWNANRRREEAEPARAADPDRSLGAKLSELRADRRSRAHQIMSGSEIVETTVANGAGVMVERKLRAFQGSAARKPGTGTDRMRAALNASKGAGR